MKRRRWTEEEDKILVQAIKANPHNKQYAFRIVSERINHSPKSCSIRWYKVLSNPYSKHYVGCTFTMVGMASNLVNRTVDREGVHITPTKIKKTIWNKIQRILGLK